MEEEFEQVGGLKVRFIERSSFGSVYYGRKHNEYITIKILKKSSNDQINSLRREAQILQTLKHENIIKFLDFREQLRCTYEDGSQKDMVGLITECATLGTLANFKKPFSEGFCRHLLKQLLSGLKHLVDNGICHRDIKPLNLVLNSQYTLKIIDFGLADRNNNLTNDCGTIEYKAPEVGIQDQAYDGEKVDVFAAGVTLFELYTGTRPFSKIPNNERHIRNDKNFLLFLNNQQEEFWTKIRQLHKHLQFSDAFISLINGMLNPNPHPRFTVQQCLDHEWMQGKIPEQALINYEISQNKYTKPDISKFRQEKKIFHMRSDDENLEEELNQIKKDIELNFENLKLKKDTFQNILNFPISNLHPEKLILILIHKAYELKDKLGFKIQFEQLSEKTYSVVFKLKIEDKVIGRIQIDLYQLEDDLIGFNIIKLEGDFDNYLKAKLALENILEQFE